MLNKRLQWQPAIILLGCLLLAGLSAQGQKPDKENYGYFNYVQPAASHALDGLEYGLLLVELSESDAYRRKLFEDKMEISHFKKAGGNNPHQFTIQVVESPFKYGRGEKKSYSEKYRENGVEKTRNRYYYEGSVDYFFTIKVLDGKDTEIFRDVIRGVENMRGAHASNISDAHENYVRSKVKARENITDKVAPRLAEMFNEQFTDVAKTIHVMAIRIKAKKHDYDGFNQAYADLERVYNILSINPDPTEESKTKLESCIQTWEALLAKATPGNDKSKMNAEVTAATCYNLGLAYFFQRSFQKSAERFSLAGSYNKKVAPGIKNWVAVSKDLAERQAVK